MHPQNQWVFFPGRPKRSERVDAKILASHTGRERERHNPFPVSPEVDTTCKHTHMHMKPSSSSSTFHGLKSKWHTFKKKGRRRGRKRRMDCGGSALFSSLIQQPFGLLFFFTWLPLSVRKALLFSSIQDEL